MAKTFYVYTILSAGAPIYVGKGNDKRWKNHFERPEVRNAPKLTVLIEICRNEKHALRKEAATIARHRRNGVQLLNDQQPRLISFARRCRPVATPARHDTALMERAAQRSVEKYCPVSSISDGERRLLIGLTAWGLDIALNGPDD